MRQGLGKEKKVKVKPSTRPNLDSMERKEKDPRQDLRYPLVHDKANMICS